MNIRNFVIIAHIDHGKSTLADRFLEITGTVDKRKMKEQFLDQMELEREKGITIKMQPVKMIYQNYILNLIDTPGHADFSYEVSRALAAVEGAILLVDATQGIQAQTLANLHMAQKENLKIIPAVNKIDLPSARIGETEKELKSLLGASEEEVFKISAKTGEGVEKLLEAVIEKVPPPSAKFKNLKTSEFKDGPPRALVFDSLYDPYLGIVVYLKIFEGKIKKGDEIFFMNSKTRAEVLEMGIFLPERAPADKLEAGEIGYVATGVKTPEKVKVGDTITKFKIQNSKFKINEAGPLPGYQEPAPMVFASVFPENQDDYPALRDALHKLKLNDAALSFEPEDSGGALGRSMKVGFLGMLHMEIVLERLRREYGLKLIFSNPSVAFKVKTKNGKEIKVYSAGHFPPEHEIFSIEEPWAGAEIIAPAKILGALTSLVNARGGKITETAALGEGRLRIGFGAPLREIIVDFYDELKSVSSGFASLAYELGEYQAADLARLDILVAGEIIPPFAEILPRRNLEVAARAKVKKLKEILPRQIFSVAIQASSKGRIIARETIPALRKNVTGYLYGGDRSRKMKLWKKQQKGKARLAERARLKIPAEVFLKMLKK